MPEQTRTLFQKPVVFIPSLLFVLFVVHSLTLDIGGLGASANVTSFAVRPNETGIISVGVDGGGDSDFEYTVDLEHGSVSSIALPIPTRGSPAPPPDLRSCGTFNKHSSQFVSPNGLIQVLCSDDSPLVLTNTITGVSIRSRLPSGVKRDAMAWSPDGSKLAVVTERMYVELFSVQGLLAALLGHPPQATKYMLWIVDTGSGDTRKISFFPDYKMVGGGAWLNWIR